MLLRCYRHEAGGLSTSEVLCMEASVFLMRCHSGAGTEKQRLSPRSRGCENYIWNPGEHLIRLKVLEDEEEKAKLLEASENLARPKAGEAIVKKF